jgi:hypothetical protein
MRHRRDSASLRVLIEKTHDLPGLTSNRSIATPCVLGKEQFTSPAPSARRNYLSARHRCHVKRLATTDDAHVLIDCPCCRSVHPTRIPQASALAAGWRSPRSIAQIDRLSGWPSPRVHLLVPEDSRRRPCAPPLRRQNAARETGAAGDTSCLRARGDGARHRWTPPARHSVYRRSCLNHFERRLARCGTNGASGWRDTR